ncbi:MAG: hypothetical protein IKP36_12040 [Bacteroidaceae bacterium]|nr:hypothetical protein [Bacteroidaceae bacterium]
MTHEELNEKIGFLFFLPNYFRLFLVCYDTMLCEALGALRHYSFKKNSKHLADREKNCTFAADLCRRGSKKRVTRWLRPAVKPVINN